MDVDRQAAVSFSNALARVHRAATSEEISRFLPEILRNLYPGAERADLEAWTVELERLLRPHTGLEPPPLLMRGHLYLELLWEHLEQRRARLGDPLDASADRVADAAVLERLTPRERQIVGRIALGETDPAVAKVLGIAPRTVSKHVEHILAKLGVETRTAAVFVTYGKRL